MNRQSLKRSLAGGRFDLSWQIVHKIRYLILSANLTGETPDNLNEIYNH